MANELLTALIWMLNNDDDSGSETMVITACTAAKSGNMYYTFYNSK